MTECGEEVGRVDRGRRWIRQRYGGTYEVELESFVDHPEVGARPRNVPMSGRLGWFQYPGKWRVPIVLVDASSRSLAAVSFRACGQSLPVAMTSS